MLTKRSIHLFVSILGGGILTCVFLLLAKFQSPLAQAERYDLVRPTVRYVATYGLDAYNDCKNHAKPCRTVQHAINQSENLDEIRVATGIYTDTHPVVDSDQVITPVLFITKTVNLRGGYTTTNWSTSYPITQPTTLDAQGKGPVIFITAGTAPLIDGFIITNGNGTDVENCGLCACDWSWIKGCGGGIYAANANPIISNNIISGNIGSSHPDGYGWGGGIYLKAAGPDTRIISNTIANNIANNAYVGHGGGILLYCSGETLIAHNKIERNLGSSVNTGVGGGIAGQLSSPHVYANSIRDNLADTGGGLFFQKGSPVLDSNTIMDNLGMRGSAIYFWVSGMFTLTNNIIAKNTSSSDRFGGGIWINGSSTDIESKGILINNTIAQNGLNAEGEGVWVGAYSFVTLTNNIIVDQTTGITNTAPYSSIISAQYNLFWGNAYDPVTGTNAVVGDPAFVNIIDNDYHLLFNSAAIDRGTNTILTTDFEGDFRPQGPAPDLGADEFYALVVTPTAVIIAGPTAGDVQESHIFTALVSPISATLPINYVWQADGQWPLTHSSGIDNSVALTWDLSGSYQITVTASNMYGTVTDAHTIIIGEAPQTIFDSNSPVPLGEMAVFTNTTTGSEPINYLWNFGDNITSTLENPIHTYTEIGIYTVTLTATNAFGSSQISGGFLVDISLSEIYLPIIFQSND